MKVLRALAVGGILGSSNPLFAAVGPEMASGSTQLVLAGGGGYRFRGGDIISTDGEWDGMHAGQADPQYSFRPRRSRPASGTNSSRGIAAPVHPMARKPAPSSLYYPADPYLPYATTEPSRGGMLFYPDGGEIFPGAYYPE